MHIAAQRTVDAGDVSSKIRREALQVCGDVQDKDVLPIRDEMNKREKEDGLVGDGKRRKKMRNPEDELPLGVYEAHPAIVHYRTDTQPTTNPWAVMPVLCNDGFRKWTKNALKITMYY